MKKIIVILISLITMVLINKFKSSSSLISSTHINRNDEMELLRNPALEDDKVLFKEDNFSSDETNKKLKIEKKISDEKIPEIRISELHNIENIIVGAEIEDVKRNFPIKDKISLVRAIKILKNSISMLKVGDIISLPFLSSEDYEATITSTRTYKNGSVSVSGVLTDSTNKYSIVLTEGKSMTFGTIITPNGSFEIEIKDEKGYLYSTDRVA